MPDLLKYTSIFAPVVFFVGGVFIVMLLNQFIGKKKSSNNKGWDIFRYWPSTRTSSYLCDKRSILSVTGYCCHTSGDMIITYASLSKRMSWVRKC